MDGDRRMRKPSGGRGRLKPPDTVTPVRVRYDIMHRLVCADHHEHGVLLACPHPDCPNGLAGDEEWIVSQPPALPDRAYQRTRWNMGGGHETFTWEDHETVFMAIPKLFWREAERAGWFPSVPADRCGFQYTSPEGFLGMLRSGELWLSDYAYLNDIAELDHGVALAAEAFADVARERPESRAMLKAQSRPDVSKHRICVASFSMSADSLSQWRAYGPIAVGFELGGLGFGYNNTVRPGPVIYDPKHQAQMLRLLGHLNASAWERERPGEKRRLRTLYFDNVDRLLDVVSFFKNAGFADEREVRMVHTENAEVFAKFGVTPSPERFRVSGGLIVPYVTTKDLAKDPPERLPITEIVIGPGPNAERQLNGVRRALRSFGYDAPVRISGITYRH